MPTLSAADFDDLLARAQLPDHIEQALRIAFKTYGPTPEVLEELRRAIEQALIADASPMSIGFADAAIESDAASRAVLDRIDGQLT